MKCPLDHHLGIADASVVKDSDSKLPLLQEGEIERRNLDTRRYHITKFRDISVHSNGRDSMDDNSVHVGRNENEKYEPFDIENVSAKEINVVDIPISSHNHKPLPRNLNPISVADVLKTLSFILVWYTFSLFLTL